MLCVTITIVKSFLSSRDELLDSRGRDRVERRGRLVEQQHLGLYRDAARDAQPLLLAARKARAALPQLVLHLVPQRALAQRPLDALVHRARESFSCIDTPKAMLS